MYVFIAECKLVLKVRVIDKNMISSVKKQMMMKMCCEEVKTTHCSTEECRVFQKLWSGKRVAGRMDEKEIVQAERKWGDVPDYQCGTNKRTALLLTASSSSPIVRLSPAHRGIPSAGSQHTVAESSPSSQPPPPGKEGMEKRNITNFPPFFSFYYI